jgi:hypothetical protein
MTIRVQKHPKLITKSRDGTPNGYLIPIYNLNEEFFVGGAEPKQVYLTVINSGKKKGPHLHFIRTGFFTCIKGNVKIVLKLEGGYKEFFSGESYDFLSVEVPIGVPAMLVNQGKEDAFILNMPNPAWTPTMNDEHDADFSDYI